MNQVVVTAPDGLPEITAGDDLAALIADAVEARDGDIVVVTSKVVSKAEGRVRQGDRETALEAETARVVARRGATTIVRTHHGLTLAAAGIDASNVEAGSIVLLPVDPDASAAALRERLLDLTGANVGVVITDTAGRAWREGQTDIAIGAAGLTVLEDFAGRVDGYGNPLAVTAPAVADEIAGAAELAQGKLGARPVALVRGRGDLVLPAGQPGPGAASVIRGDGGDLFGYGAREAVLRALAGHDEDRVPFGASVPVEDLVAGLGQVAGGGFAATVRGPDRSSYELELAGELSSERVAAVCFASGWRLDRWSRTESGVVAHVSPATP